MRETVMIDGKPVELKATASTLRRYRAWFNRDLVKDFKTVEKELRDSGGDVASGDVLEIIQNLTYVMARQADSTIPNNIDDWLDQFESFPIEEFAVDVVTLWAKSLKADIELKNA
jgi:hypothetical protein